MGLLITLFGRRQKGSSVDAKQRLLDVLIHDRINLPSATLDKIREELLAVLSKYIEVDRDRLDVQVTREEGLARLTANIPIRRSGDPSGEPEIQPPVPETGGREQRELTTSGARRSGTNTPQTFGPQHKRRH